MKKRLLYTLLIFVLFLMPFLILSNHFINTVDEINLNNTLLRLDISMSSLSYQLSDMLVQNYDVLKDIRNKRYDKEKIIEKLKEIKSKSIIVKNLSLYNGKNLEFSTDKNTAPKNIDTALLENAKQLKIPIGQVIYPKDAPPELLTAEYLSDRLVVSITDLGYLNELLLKMSKKLHVNLYLFDGDENIIFDSNYDYIFNYNVKPHKEISELVSALISKNIFSYKGVTNINGKKSLVSIYNVETTKWWIYSIIDYNKTVNNELRDWAKRVVYSGIILIFVFSYISVLIMEKFYIRKNL